MKSIAGAILAGGKSSRFDHRPKGLLELPSGETIIERLLSEIEKAGVDPRVICAGDKRLFTDLGVPVIPDRKREMGPLGGIEAALFYFKDRVDAVLFLPCDIPNITADEIRRLCEKFRLGTGEILVAETADAVWHPLCCVLPVGMYANIEKAVRSGHLSVKRLWRDLGAESLRFENAGRFMNVNFPEDFNAVLKAVAAETGSTDKEVNKKPTNQKRKDDVMTVSINVPEAIQKEFGEFLEKENIALAVVSDASGEVSIVTGEEQRENSISTLYPGGWIKCEVAQGMARKLSIRYGDMGKILNHFNIKIRDCNLGCF